MIKQKMRAEIMDGAPRSSDTCLMPSDWPTFPQLYVDKQLVGGCDIVTSMFKSGELQQTFTDAGVPLEYAALFFCSYSLIVFSVHLAFVGSLTWSFYVRCSLSSLVNVPANPSHAKPASPRIDHVVGELCICCPFVIVNAAYKERPSTCNKIHYLLGTLCLEEEEGSVQESERGRSLEIGGNKYTITYAVDGK